MSDSGSGVSPIWDLINTLIPAVIPTAVAAALEVWRVRRRDRERGRHRDIDDGDEEDDQ